MAEARRRRWPWVAGVLVVALVAAGFWVLRPGRNPVAYRTTTVQAMALSQTVTASGTINPARRANLNFVGGSEVTKVNVAVGDQVKKGQALASEDDAALKISVQSAEADLTAAEQSLANLRDSGASSTAISAAEATVQVKRNSLTQARNNLARATLTAPFDGVVAQVNVAVGDQTTAGGVTSGINTAQLGGSASSRVPTSTTVSTTTSAAIVVISADQFTVSTTVSSADVSMIKKGMPVAITPAGATKPIPGTVSSVGVEATTSAGGNASFPVTVDVTGSPSGLLAGASAQLVITVKELPSAIAVPTQAIKKINGKASVQRLVEGNPVDTEVTVGEVVGYQTVITNGLREGDVIVVGRPSGGPTQVPGSGPTR